MFAPYLAEHYDLALSSFYGLEGARLRWNGISVFPGVGQNFGNAYLLEHAKDHFGGDPKGGLVVTLMDAWVLDREMASKLNLACWAPVDHEPIPFNVANFFQASGAVPIAMSRFGEEQFKNVGLDPLYVPHAVDTNVYKPHDDEREATRTAMGIAPDAFVVGMVAANKGTPSRKGFSRAFSAFAIFREKHPDARLYLHTVTEAAYAAGEDVITLARAVGIEDALSTPPQYHMLYDPLPPFTMAKLYSAMDVLLNPAMGEGFGVPIIEAASCGIPSVVTNFTAMPEVAGPAGWHVGWTPHWTPAKSWWALADVPEIVEALELCYRQSDQERKVRSERCRDHALTYDIRKVLNDHMLPALEAAQERFTDRKPSVSKRELVKP